jgi:hypothetical protein
MNTLYFLFFFLIFIVTHLWFQTINLTVLIEFPLPVLARGLFYFQEIGIKFDFQSFKEFFEIQINVEEFDI